MTDSSNQLAFLETAISGGGLLSEHFLADRLPERQDFRELEVEPLRRQLRELWARERDALPQSNEAQTEERFIKPVLSALGFEFTVQAGLSFASGRRQPDYALYLSASEREAADDAPASARYEHAVAVADAKRFGRPLQGRPSSGPDREDPAAQIINYVSITRRPWGLLTDGRWWRLYASKRGLIDGACYEVDLPALLEADRPDALRWFAAFFSAAALRPGPDGHSLATRLLDESTASAVQVGDALERQVFAAVPQIAEGLLGDDERTDAALSQAFEGSLVFLYRLLFCLYAEARELLPVENPHYREYSLNRQRAELAEDTDAGRRFSTQSDDLYNDLRGLFRMVDGGDPATGVPEYNGGLFSARRNPYFTGRFVPDSLLAPALDRVYRVGGELVDYRDLSVRHLGTIYERFLDYRLEGAGTALVLVPATGRRETGSYFTPSHVVDAIVERTLDPVLERRSREIVDASLRGRDCLDAFLELRVCDPAMGSAHFLVAAAGYIAQYVATDPSYDGELSLTEIQRLVAERCIYGVDLNPMAVELAQLALWLTTVSRDEPLTFLTNLRCGNSLVGADVTELLAGEGTLFAERLARDSAAILANIGEIESRPSRTGADVHAKEERAAVAEGLRAPLESFAQEQVVATFGGDVRAFHWELEFPEVFLAADGRPRADGGFDAVIGNPPYVRIQALGRALAEWCRAHYQTATGNFDVSVPFIERSLALLRRGGRLGFIVPNKLPKLDYGKRLRERFARDRLVEELIDFGDAQVFEGATNYTCVLVLDTDGHDELAYRRVRGDSRDVRDALVNVPAVEAERFDVVGLGAEPWVLAVGEEARLLRTAAEGSARLDKVTGRIFTGLQTSADQVYIVEDRGRRGDRQVVYSRASRAEVELEPDLLHPLASGGDVDRHAFLPLRDLLLFPYHRGEDGAMRLVTEDELAELPLTAAYLREHEDALRARERRTMDHDGWYAFGRTQSLGVHDRPKLGVAATVKRLEIAADPDGAVYFHNVRVNGILLDEEGPSIWTLLALLNSRLLDYVFRRGAAEHQNGHFAANKQFIAPLPIRLPADPAELDRLGERLHDRAARIAAERRGFLDWLAGAIGGRLGDLSGSKVLRAYDEHTVVELLAVLHRNASRTTSTGSRAFHEQLEREHGESLDRLAPLRAGLARDERDADELVYDLYGLDAGQRELVESEYELR